LRAAWIESWGGSLQHGERPDPVAGDGEVLVDVEACGVGLTVLNCIRGDLGADPADLPRVPGHELVGRIAAAGPGVDPRRVGQRVMSHFYLFCGECRRCAAGQEPLCERLEGYVGVDRDGGYAARAALPARNAVPLPAGLDATLATAIPDAIATPVHVARRAAIAPGDRVAVVGAGGGVGVHMVQVARLHGADVAGLDAVDSKLRYLRDALGCHAVDSSDFATAGLPEGWQSGADVVVDLVGTVASLAWSVEHLAVEGRLVVLTTFPGVEVRVSPRELTLKQASVVGSRYAGRAELALAARLVATGAIDPVVSRCVAIDEVEDAHAALREGSLLGRAALVWDRDEGGTG
jgi:D-arabinose 1-dehydrogenase-like Zn-dependent alcohol dehydrogenase